MFEGGRDALRHGFRAGFWTIFGVVGRLPARMPDDAVALDPLVRFGPVILLGGMVALFTCSRVLASIFARPEGPVGARAMALFVPIAAASLTAMLLGRPEIAIGVVFGTSVGAVTTAIGFVALAEPIAPGPARWRRLWAFLLATAMLVFVAGFKGTLNWRDAVALMVEGLLLLTLWNDSSEAGGAATTHADVLQEAARRDERHEAIALNYATPARAQAWTLGRVLLLTVELGLLAALLWLGGWAVTQGSVRSSTLLRGMSTSGLAASVVSLSLVLPMMYGSWRMAAGGRGWAPVTAQIGVVLLNLCALLPALILLPYLAAHVPAVAYWAGDAMAWHEGLPKLLVYPAPVWRIDNVLLILMGVLILPVALGKWSLGREEGLALIAGYFYDLTATVATGLTPSLR
jgi:Ca2+/Na+ antiporter